MTSIDTKHNNFFFWKKEKYFCCSTWVAVWSLYFCTSSSRIQEASPIMRIRKADFEVVTACNTVAPVFPMLRCSLQTSKLVYVDKKRQYCYTFLHQKCGFKSALLRTFNKQKNLSIIFFLQSKSYSKIFIGANFKNTTLRKNDCMRLLSFNLLK